MAEQRVSVLVVDDLPRVRDALTTLLTTFAEIGLAGVAINGQEAVRQVEALHPAVVLMDLEMPVMNGYAATEAIVSRGLAAVVVLSIHSDAASRARALAAGASALIEKGGPPDELLQALLDASRPAGARAPAPLPAASPGPLSAF